jgi:hypothetical protein
MREPPAGIPSRFFDCPQGDKPLPDYQPGAWLAAPPPGQPPAAATKHRPLAARPGSDHSQTENQEGAAPKEAGSTAHAPVETHVDAGHGSIAIAPLQQSGYPPSGTYDSQAPPLLR